MTEFACPKCGCIEIDSNRGYFYDDAGHVIGEDFDPACKKCGESFDEETWRLEKVVFS